MKQQRTTTHHNRLRCLRKWLQTTATYNEKWIHIAITQLRHATTLKLGFIKTHRTTTHHNRLWCLRKLLEQKTLTTKNGYI